MHIHTHTHTHIYIYICVYTHIYIYTHIYMYMYICIHTYIYTRICIYIYIYIYLSIYLYLYLHPHVYIYISLSLSLSLSPPPLSLARGLSFSTEIIGMHQARLSKARPVAYAFTWQHSRATTGWERPWSRMRLIAGDQATRKPARANSHTLRSAPSACVFVCSLYISRQWT